MTKRIEDRTETLDLSFGDAAYVHAGRTKVILSLWINDQETEAVLTLDDARRLAAMVEHAVETVEATIPIMKAVTADPASMAKTELDRLREENRELKAKLFKLGVGLEELA